MSKPYTMKEILITGGTGTLGKEITKQLLTNYPNLKGIRIFSRDEEKHRAMSQELSQMGLGKKVSFLIGDIRDKDRLQRAMNGVDIVFHTAAMKQIPHCEYNPIEAVKTNVDGTCNVIDACIDNKVKKAMLISTDKACYPVNLYGATKTVAEKMFLHANVYSPDNTKFNVCRYGNVIGSRGSVIPIFLKQYKESKRITVTDLDMTRFWITVKDVAKFVIHRMCSGEAGKTYIPKMQALSMMQLVEIILPYDDLEIDEIGTRKGEKKHECLITSEESIDILDEHNSALYSNDCCNWDPEEFKTLLIKEGYING